MQELERMIDIYHAAFIISLVLAVIFLIVSITLFFRFNIRGIFDMRSGRGARKTIQKMQELNDQTGKLRQDVVAYTSGRLSPEERITLPPTEKTAVGDIQEALRQESLAAQGSQETELLSPQQSKEEELLMPQGSQETELLVSEESTAEAFSDGQDETKVLSREEIKDNPQSENGKLPGAFKIEKEIMWIHTEEII